MDNLNLFDRAENLLGSATAIQFFPTLDYTKEPPIVALIFSKPEDGIEGYNLLLDNYKDKNATLVIFKKDTGIDISIVAKDTADAINIKHLSFDSSQLDDFLAKEPKDRRFVFAIGFISGSHVSFVPTRQPFSPVVLDKYEIA